MRPLEVKATRMDTMYELMVNLILHQVSLEKALLQQRAGKP